jgi:hypothetical protein
MIPLAYIGIALSMPLVGLEPSMSLELRPIQSTRTTASPSANDPALDKLMAESLSDRAVRSVGRRTGTEEVVTAIVAIRARTDILVNPHRVRLEVRDISGNPLRTRCKHHLDPSAEFGLTGSDGEYVRLHRGEKISMQLQAGLLCYDLARGDKYEIFAVFEDSGDPFREPPPEGVTVAMRRMTSNKVTLTYSGSRERRITRR